MIIINSEEEFKNNEIISNEEIKNETVDQIDDLNQSENNSNSDKRETITKKQDNFPNKEVTEKKEIILGNSKSIKKEDKNKSKRKILITSIIFLITIFLFLLLSTIFALLQSNKTTIISGVNIKGIDISGLTKEDAINKINNICNSKLTSAFELSHGEYSISITGEQLESSFDIESSINSAYELGRKNNIFINNYEIIKAFIFKITISPSFNYNEEIINSLITEINSNLSDKLIEPSYSIEEDKLLITKGISGIIVDSDLLKLKIITNLNNFVDENSTIQIPTIDKEASLINIEQIYSEIHTEAVDASFTKDPFTVQPEVNGVDFAISMDEAKAILTEDKESYVIPLKITKPKVTTNDIGSEAFPNLLGSFSTTYSTKNTNRSTNISLASKKVNGVVLMPGQIFSYNQTVGQRTVAAGFKEAAVYSGGEVTTGIGGGICQVSSTLYNSVLLANLQIVERYNHGFNPGYVKAGTDATVSWGGPDFKFKNNRNYPIKIVCSGSGGTITTKIYGLKEDNEPEVSVEAYVTSYIPFSTINKEDSSLPAGTTKVLESGSNGCKSVAYRVLKQNGQVISKTLLSSDTYSPHNRIVLVGTAGTATSQTTVEVTEEVVPTPTPQATPTPTPIPSSIPTPTPTPTPTPNEIQNSEII